MGLLGRLSVKEQQHKVRDDAILDATHVLLARKGFDLMTVDEVAAQAGVAKASLYKHFDSKDALAAAAMTRLLDRALAFIAAQPPDLSAYERLVGVLRWALELRLQGGLPLLPSTSPALRDGLLRNKDYVKRILRLNEEMTRLVDAAKREGRLAAALPSEVMLFSIYARTCDPSVDYLRMSGHYTDAQIVDYLLATAFEGMAAPAAAGSPPRGR
jgi:AcrR family transcriptional regulator